MKCKNDVDGHKEEEGMEDENKDNAPEKNKENKDNNNELPKLFYSLLYSYMTWATASSVIIILFCYHL